jgi:hypothetical protein
VVLVPTAGTSLKPTELVPSTVQPESVPEVGVPRTGVTKVGVLQRPKNQSRFHLLPPQLS